MGHVTTGCRDCKKCTNSGVANLGRNSARAGVAFASVGMSELVRGFTKNCQVCGHKLSLHRPAVGVPVTSPPAPPASGLPSPSSMPPAGWLVDEAQPGMLRWWDGNGWTEHLKPATE